MTDDGGHAPEDEPRRRFPAGSARGTATAASQVEGAAGLTKQFDPSYVDYTVDDRAPTASCDWSRRLIAAQR